MGVGRLHAGVGLKSKPGGVLFIDVVIDSTGLYLFMIIARMRDALAIRATISIIHNGGLTSAHIQRTAKDPERRSAGISVERKHLFIERDGLWWWLIDRTSDGIGAPQRELLPELMFKFRGW